MIKQDIERLYDTAVRFIFSHGAFDSLLLKKAMRIDDETTELLLNKMLENKAISPASDGGVYTPLKTYIHSEYLLNKELKEDEKKKGDLKIKKQNNNISLFIFIIALAFFFVTCFFALREPMTLVFIIPSVLLCSWVAEKLGGGIGLLGILSIVVCASSLMWVNSKTPIFGDDYAEKKRYEDTRKAAKKQEYKEEAQRVIASDNAEKLVKSTLKDPDSAVFSGERTGKSGAVCGQVNAKNSFGAYIGNSRYIVLGGGQEIDDGSQSFSDKWNSVCN